MRAFSLLAQPATVRVGENVRLVLTIHVDETVGSFDNVQLPDTSGFTPEGDERRLTSTPGGGTTYVETLTLSATDPGLHQIAAASVEAIDAESGTAKRFSSNAVDVRVLPQVVSDVFWVEPMRREFARLWSAFVRLAVFGVLFVLALRVLAFFRRPAAPVAIVDAPVAAPPPQRATTDDRDALRRATDALSTERTRPRVIDVRIALRRVAGGRADETLADLERRLAGDATPELIGALRAVERASFCEIPRLDAAIEAAIVALRRLHDVASVRGTTS